MPHYTTRASIVIPLRVQHPAWLAQSVRSALAQTEPCQVIVVASHDTPGDNHEVLDALRREHDRLEILVAPETCGYACAFNLGIAHARGERVGFLLADDWLATEAVARCLAHEEDIVSTRMAIHDAEGSRVIERGSETNEALAALGSAQEKADYLGHFLLFRREVLLAAGGVDTRVGATGPDDYDLLWTLIEGGASVRVVEQVLYHYRDHDEDWRLSLRPAGEQLDNLERILDKHALPDEQRTTVREKHGRWYGQTIGQVRAKG